ncbi:unnamed protein product [Orchesella dallaii]|uniref:Uncharacterized protein n=1 Tax=Orchesella dallaii TaxID=48710 RepID=A0ABP1R6V1_9HEXA
METFIESGTVNQFDSYQLLSLLSSCSLIGFIGTFGIPEWYDLLKSHISFHSNTNIPIVIDIIENTVDGVNFGRYDDQILLNESHPYPPSPFRDFHPKYFRGGCTVQTLFVDLSSNNFRKILKTIVMSREDPTIILLYFNKTTEQLYSDEEIFSKLVLLYKIDVTSKFLIMTQNEIFLQSIHSVPIGHSSDLENILVPLTKSFETLQDLKKKWQQVHKNLNQRYILYKKNFDRFYNRKACSFYHSGLVKGSDLEPADCSFIVAGHHYNFSTTPFVQWGQPGFDRRKRRRRPGLITFSRVSTHGLGSVEFIRHEFFHRPEYMFRSQWIGVPTPYNSFKLVIYAPKNSPSKDFLMLFRPFGISTWVAWVFAFLATVLTLFSLNQVLSLKEPGALYKIHDVSSRLSRLEQRAFWMISVVFQQSDNDSMQNYLEGNYSHSGVLILSLTWILTCFTLCNFYTGSLFSFMTTDLLPQNLPQTLREAFDNKIFIGTTTYHYHKNDRYSTFKDLVLFPMIDRNDPLTYPFYNGMFNLVYFLNEISKSDLINKIARQKPVNTDRGKVVVPRLFAILTSESDIKILTELIHRDTDYVSIVNKVRDATPFISRIPWIGQRNFFLPLFENVLERLVESGLYQRWEFIWRYAYYYRELKRSMLFHNHHPPQQQRRHPLQQNWGNNRSNEWKRRDMRGNENRISGENLYSFLMLADTRPKLLVEPMPLPLRSVTVLLVFVSSLFVLTVAVAGLEKIWHSSRERQEWRENYFITVNTIKIETCEKHGLKID